MEGSRLTFFGSNTTMKPHANQKFISWKVLHLRWVNTNQTTKHKIFILLHMGHHVHSKTYQSPPINLPLFWEGDRV